MQGSVYVHRLATPRATLELGVCILPPTSYLLPPTSYLLPPTSYLLPPTLYLLPPTSYLLHPALLSSLEQSLDPSDRFRLHGSQGPPHIRLPF